jgi:hypothetical protein
MNYSLSPRIPAGRQATAGIFHHPEKLLRDDEDGEGT